MASRCGQADIRPAHTHLIEAPLAVPQDTSWANNQVVYAGGDSVHFRRRLRQMHLATPAGHDDVVGISPCASEARAFPKTPLRRASCCWEVWRPLPPQALLRAL